MAAPTSEDFSGLSSAVSALTAVMNSNLATKATEEEKSLANAQKLEGELNKFTEKVKAATGKIPGAESIAQNLNALSASLKANIQEMTAIRNRLSSGLILPDSIKTELTDRLKELNESVAGARAKFDVAEQELEKASDAFTELNNKLKRSLEDDVLNAVFKEYGESVKIVLGKFGAVISDAMRMAAEGIKRASSLAITAQQGVALEFTNQRTSIASAFANIGDPNRIVNKEQLYSAQEGIVDALGGIAAGMELDPGAIENMVGGMREGLNSQITPTAETFRSLSQMGIEPTTQGLSQLREASGRAGLGLNQMNVLARNAMAVQIFGQGIVKTTLDLERMGISIQSVMRQSESYVTNLDGAIDSIAQLNQLGVQLDFGELTQLQEFDPAAAIQYVADKISPEQLQSTSFRALLASVPGINMEEVLKLKGMGGLEKLEQGTTKQEEAVSTNTKMFTALTQVVSALSGSFAGLIVGTVAATIALARLAGAGGLGGVVNNLKSLLPGAGGTGAAATTGAATTALSTGAKMMSGAKVGAGMGALTGIMSGVAEYQQSGSIMKAMGRGLANLAGSVIGGALGSFIPIPGVGTMLGSMAGAWAANWLVDKVFKADDMTSVPGYGDRKLVTPSATFSLNNSDTVMAGTNLFSKGALQTGTGGQASTALMGKIDRLITVLENAETVININNTSQKVKRTTLVGVRERDAEV